MSPYTYYAFISYKRNGEDQKWAEAIYSQLISYDLKVYFKGVEESVIKQDKISATDKTIKPLFKDTEQFTTGDILSDKIKSELQKSRKLIVICSQRMKAKEYWINEEVKYFREIGHGPKDILPIIIEMDASKADPSMCFPSALPVEWHAVNVRDHQLSKNDGFIINTLMPFDKTLRYRKTILSLIPPLFDKVKHPLQELWEMDRRRRETKFLFTTLGTVLVITILSLLLYGLYNERTCANEEKSMRMIEIARGEMADHNMQKAALLLTKAQNLEDGFMIGKYSDFAKKKICIALIDFYITADTIRDYLHTPLILSKNEDGSMLLGYRKNFTSIFFLDTVNFVIKRTIEMENSIENIKLSRTGRYIFVEGLMDLWIIDTKQMKTVFKKDKVHIGSGSKFANGFTCSVPPYCFSSDEKYAYYINSNGEGNTLLECVELATGNVNKLPLKGQDGATTFLSHMLGNKIIHVCNSAVIIDLDKKTSIVLNDTLGRIYKADLVGNNLMTIQRKNYNDALYYVYVFDAATLEKKNCIPIDITLRERFNASINHSELVIVDNYHISYYPIGCPNPRMVTDKEFFGRIKNLSVNSECILFENNGVYYIHDLKDGTVLDSVKLPFDKNNSPIESRLFTSTNFLIFTDLRTNTVIYKKNSITVDNNVERRMTGFIYSGTGDYYASVTDFRHVKIIETKSNNLVREFDAPIWILGCQNVVNRDEFIFRCGNEFAIYQPQTNFILVSPKEEADWRNFDRLERNGEGLKFMDDFNNNAYMSSYETQYEPLVLDKDITGEIGSYCVNFSNNAIRKIANNRIPFSNYFYIVENERNYRFVNYKTNDTLALTYEAKGQNLPSFSINTDREILLATEIVGYAMWKNFLFSFSGKEIASYDFVSPKIVPWNDGFLISSITHYGLFHIAFDGELEKINKLDALSGFILTPDKKQFILFGLSGKTYIVDIKDKASTYRLSISSSIDGCGYFSYSANGRYLYLERMLLKERNGYEYYDCIIDLQNISIFMKWARSREEHISFNFIGTDKFMYITYNNDGTIKKISRGSLDDDFIYKQVKQYGNRELTEEELDEYGL